MNLSSIDRSQSLPARDCGAPCTRCPRWLTPLLIALSLTAVGRPLAAEDFPLDLLQRLLSPQPARRVAPTESPQALPLTEPSALERKTSRVQPPGERYLLVACSLPGDADHRTEFTTVLKDLREQLAARLQFAPERMTFLFGNETDAAGLEFPASPCTRETLAAAVQQLKDTVQPADSVWVWLMGHSHFDGRHTFFNMAGPDLDERGFAALWQPFPQTREQLFWITTPASGYFIKPLAAPGRIVLSATDVDQEINETVFAKEFAKLLIDPPDLDLLDFDSNGEISLLDLYLNTVQRVERSYLNDKLLCTEHALLDDTSDGRGQEIQAAFLPPELGGRRQPGSAVPPFTANADGATAAKLVLPWKHPPPVPPASALEAANVATTAPAETPSAAEAVGESPGEN